MTESTKLKVLAVVDYYLPGYKGGGPAVSVSRLIGCLKQEYDFFVYTRNHDLGEREAYPDVASSAWRENDGIQYFYAGPRDLTIFGLWKVLRQTQPDVIYLNSY